MSTSAKAQMYIDYLAEEGFRPTLSELGHVTFKEEGRVYAIIVEERDPLFFRLVFPSFWEFQGEAQRPKILAAADHATATTKVAKVFMVRDEVWASIEIFLPAPEHFRDVFPRSMGALKAAVRLFLERMQANEGVTAI